MGHTLHRRSKLNRPLPTGMNRRLFLRSGLSLGGAAAVTAGAAHHAHAHAHSHSQGVAPAGPVNRRAPVSFAHGVASGDPTAQSAILWTRITPSDRTASYEVTCRVFEGSATAAGRLLSEQVLLTSALRDFTVKFDAQGLSPGRHHWYDFTCNGVTSRQGRTKTAPVNDPGKLKFGLVSCSSLAHGYFHAYRKLAQAQDLDAVVHLGDYLYEYGSGEYGNVRACQPSHEIITLSDYRTRHGQYKSEDLDLQDLHARHPFITIWDDHESADNSHRDGAANHTEGAEGVWVQRKAWAQQAYDEWMPIRLPEAGNADKIWRRLRYGRLVDWLMLDTRLFARTVQADTPINPLTTDVNSPRRKMIGDVQLDALKGWLNDKTATWKLIGNQVVFHPWIVKPGSTAVAELAGAVPQIGPQLAALTSPSGLNGDSWDAYAHERRRIMNVLSGTHADGAGGKVNNVVFLTGDVHSSWVADITPDPNNPLSYNRLTGAGSLATEFVITSVTSPGLPLPNQFGNAFELDNPHIRYINFSDRGYAVLTVTAQQVECAYTHVSDVTQKTLGATTPGPVFTVRKDSNTVAQRLPSVSGGVTVHGGPSASATEVDVKASARGDLLTMFTKGVLGL